MTLARLTVITPSLNQANYLERTLRSVLDQGYPDLEYIVMDGGSTDGSIEILRRYDDRLAYWVSQRDEGQSWAINRAIEQSTGEVVAYINSDDYYLPGRNLIEVLGSLTITRVVVDLFRHRVGGAEELQTRHRRADSGQAADHPERFEGVGHLRRREGKKEPAVIGYVVHKVLLRAAQRPRLILGVYRDSTSV